MRRRASVLSPIARMAVAGGPMKVSPASATASGNGARSERKPYPGVTAWQSVARAASRSLAMSRYDSAAGAAPIGTARWAARTWGESRSASEYTATDSSPSSWQARTIRRAISPRFATRTRVKGAIRRHPSTAAARYLVRQAERLERLAQGRRRAGGAGVQRQGGWGPRVVAVEREAQRGEDEIARWYAVVLQVGARHPDQRPRGPADAWPGWPVEQYGHADGAPFRQLGERRVRVVMARQLQVGGDAAAQHGVPAPRRERHGQQVGAKPAREAHVPRGVGFDRVRGEQHAPHRAGAQQVLAQLVEHRRHLQVQRDRAPFLRADVDPPLLPGEAGARAPRLHAQHAGAVPVGGRAGGREPLAGPVERVVGRIEQGADSGAVVQRVVRRL